MFWLQSWKPSRQVISHFWFLQTAVTIARQITDESLGHATTILRNRTFAYTHGETRLVEVLEAQRTYQSSYQAYYEALLNVAIAQAEMERACGM